MEKRKIGLSIASLFPWCFQPANVFDMVRKAGYDGVQILPIRGWNNLPALYNSQILSYEGPWRTGTFQQVVRRWRTGDESLPPWWDWVLFGPKANELYASWQARFASLPVVASQHAFNHLGPVEVHPELSTHTPDYWHYMPEGVVLDTWHLQRPHRITGKGYSTTWFVLMQDLAPSSIKLLHFQPPHAELQDLLAGRITPSAGILKTLMYKTASTLCPVIVEVGPNRDAIAHPVAFFDKLRRLVRHLGA